MSCESKEETHLEFNSKKGNVARRCGLRHARAARRHRHRHRPGRTGRCWDDLCINDDGTSTGTSGTSNVLGIQGPFPNYDGFSSVSDLGSTEATEDHNLLLVGQTYLFAIVNEDAISTNNIDVSVDDEEGDADIESYADANGLATDAVVAGAQTWIDLPGSGVDDVDLIDNELLASWDLPSVLPVENAFVQDLNDDWDRSFYNFTASTSILDCVGGVAVADGLSFITVTCDEAGEFEITAFEDAVTDNVVTNDYICVNAPTTVTLTATPTTVESVPAVGNVSHSLLVLTVTDSAGGYTIPGWAVDWTVGGRCTIDALTEAQYQATNACFLAYKISNPTTGYDLENYLLRPHRPDGIRHVGRSFNIDGSPAPGYQARSLAAAILHCEGATPGVASVRAELDRSPLSDSVGDGGRHGRWTAGVHHHDRCSEQAGLWREGNDPRDRYRRHQPEGFGPHGC